MFVSTFSTDPSLHIADADVKSIVLAMIINFGGGGVKEFVLVYFYVINTLLHVIYVLLASK